MVAPVVRAQAPRGRVRYVPCPVCTRVMNRVNFAHRSAIIIDVCKQHGSWFDAGELPRVLAFVEEGGLGRSMQRELMEHESQQRAARHAGAHASAGMEGHEVAKSADELTSIARLVWDILFW